MADRSIVFFTQLYYPDITTTAVIMTELAEDLALYGLKVKAICAQPTYMNKQRCSKIEVHCGVLIRRVWTVLYNKNKMLGRISNGMSCFFNMLFKMFFTKKSDLLVFNTNPALLPLLGVIGAKLRGQRYVLLIHDLWPELPAHTGMIRKGGLLYRFIDFLNKLSIKNASGIIVLSNKMKELILNKVPRKKNEINVIHNWADASRIFPVPRNNNHLIDKFGLRNKRVVMYSGNLGRYQPLEVMIEAAYELKDRKDINFVFAGDGGKKKPIQVMADSMNLENVIFIPFQSLERLAESLSMADVSLMGIYPKNEGVIMPSKLYGLLAIEKPIICVSDRTSEVVEILDKSGAGFGSAIDDSKELAQKIVELIDYPEKARKMGLNGRTYFLEHYERKSLTKKWQEVLNNIVHSGTDVQYDPYLMNSKNLQVPRSEKRHRFSYDPISSQNISR
jgi:glycosyltransferase involved in cell wall biosynthesis